MKVIFNQKNIINDILKKKNNSKISLNIFLIKIILVGILLFLKLYNEYND